MSYKFGTQYFAITDKSVLMLRNRYPYREIAASEISRVELTKGTDVKNRTMSIIFGGLLLSAAFYLLINFSGFNPNDLSGSKAGKTVGYLIVMELFLLGLGGYAIYRALPVHSIIKLSMSSGETESLSIYEVIKKGSINTLLTSLKEAIGENKISVDHDLKS